MSFSLNSTVILTASEYLTEAQKYLSGSASRVAFLAFINIPLIVIALNVLRQLVHCIVTHLLLAADMRFSCCPETRRYPPKSFTSYPS
jgi:hypothetical protein